MIETALYRRLTADATVASWLKDRVYPDEPPQDAPYPYAVYSLVSHPESVPLDGPTGRPHPRIQIDVVARTRHAARLVARAVRKRVHGSRGQWDGVFVERSVVVDERYDYYPPQQGEGKGVYVVSLDLEIWYRDTL